MPYKVLLKHNPTGVTVFTDVEHDWEKEDGYTDYFWWTDGNFGCDCNREMEFLRGFGVPEKYVMESDAPCMGHDYTAVKAILPSGEEIVLDEEV